MIEIGKKLLMEEIRLTNLRLVVYPIIYKVLAPSQVVGLGISEPSTKAPLICHNINPHIAKLVSEMGCPNTQTGAPWEVKGFSSGDPTRYFHGWDAGSPKRWMPVANRPSPNWQESYTTYIPLISTCRTWGVKNATKIPPFRGTRNNH